MEKFQYCFICIHFLQFVGRVLQQKMYKNQSVHHPVLPGQSVRRVKFTVIFDIITWIRVLKAGIFGGEGGLY